MKNKRLFMIASIILMAIGFATVATTLYINGDVEISGDVLNFDKDIIFVNATTDDGGLTSISEDGKEITYVSKTLKVEGEYAKLNFKIKNNNRNYDASAKIRCVFIDEDNNETSTNEFIKLELSDDTFEISSGSSATGVLTATVKKLTPKETDIGIQCTVIGTAVERTSLGDLISDDSTGYSGNISNCNDTDCALSYLDSMVENR